MRFDILNRLGVDHECDEWTDRTAVSNRAAQRPALNIQLLACEHV